MGSFSIWHWLVVLVVVVLIFGTKKLRNIGGDVGGAVKNFKEAMGEAQAGKDGVVSNQESATNNVAKAGLIEADFVDVPVKKAAPKRKVTAAKKTVSAKPRVSKPRATKSKPE